MGDRDRLIELLKKPNKTAILRKINPQFVTDETDEESIVADYLLANGVICPPCKVGQTVYYIAFGKVYKGKCHAITIHKDSLQIHLYDYDGDNASISAKDVFLTREEAEKALERSKGNETNIRTKRQS